ncbi:MAG: lipid IV(A) 3-deoxy-D-manno-octulosonic acid transferase [Nitrosomonadales bacterium]|nr:lipid IV(A) 3-deoxy-D-manno-octulosonic acid transferase [Nitrosomonadales bacterium]
MRFFYTVVLWLLLPYIFLRLLWRARKQPEYLRHVGERFGFYSIRSDKPVIWLHAVSVGETRATQSLVTRLCATYPGHQILLTHTTPTGRAAGEQLYGNSVLRVYLPYDYPFAVNNFLRHFRPQLGILMETEIWFNLIHACHKTGAPLLLLNARMSEKSARGYARFSHLTHNALSELAAIAAQTADDAARLTNLGARDVSVMGNLKFDIVPQPAMLELGRQLREQFGMARKVFLAASTRDGEEELLLNALKKIHIPDLLLVIVPRHPQRFAEVAHLLDQRSIAFQYRSANRTVSAEVQVVLGDSMGEMFAYYAAADLAFIGGSLLPYGGQNLIEACAVGTPVLIGPHTHNFAEATRLAIGAGAAVQVQNSDGLVAELQRLLGNPDSLCEMQKKCAGFVKFNRGATDKSLRIIKSFTGQ